jgi:hypothetical protein
LAILCEGFLHCPRLLSKDLCVRRLLGQGHAHDALSLSAGKSGQKGNEAKSIVAFQNGVYGSAFIENLLSENYGHGRPVRMVLERCSGWSPSAKVLVVDEMSGRHTTPQRRIVANSRIIDAGGLRL